jgi:hypothetical protein
MEKEKVKKKKKKYLLYKKIFEFFLQGAGERKIGGGHQSP